MKARMRDEQGNITDDKTKVHDLEFYMDYGTTEFPNGYHRLPVIIKGSRDKQNRVVWSWNGDLDKPTLKPSISTKHGRGDNGKQEIAHCWLNDGRTQFLSDSTIPNKNKTVDLIDMDIWGNNYE
jgi:hypothetical protein